MRRAKIFRYRFKQADWWLPPAATWDLQSDMIAAAPSPDGSLLWAAGAITSSMTWLGVTTAWLFAGIRWRQWATSLLARWHRYHVTSRFILRVCVWSSDVISATLTSRGESSSCLSFTDFIRVSWRWGLRWNLAMYLLYSCLSFTSFTSDTCFTVLRTAVWLVMLVTFRVMT